MVGECRFETDRRLGGSFGDLDEVEVRRRSVTASVQTSTEADNRSAVAKFVDLALGDSSSPRFCERIHVPKFVDGRGSIHC